MENIYVTKSSMPDFDDYVEMIKPLWDSHLLTNMGKYHNEFEKELKERMGVEYVSLAVNGHSALELAIQMMKFPKGSEVITTPYTFVSTTHAILRNGLKPIFCDIKDDYTIDETKIEELITENTVAILPVHTYGNICAVEKIRDIAYRYDLKVIYDAAHAFNETYKGVSVAGYGDVSIFSFHATKVFNTIEGGCVCCHSKEQYDALYNLKNFGIRSEELVVAVGGNSKMNEFQAAMGLCNLKCIDDEIARRKNVVTHYLECLKDCKGITVNNYRDEVKWNYAYFPVLFETGDIRNKLYDSLKEHGIFARKYFWPLTADHVCFKNKYKNVDLKKARNLSERILVLPLYSDLRTEDVERICGIIRDV